MDDQFRLLSVIYRHCNASVGCWNGSGFVSRNLGTVHQGLV